MVPLIIAGVMAFQSLMGSKKEDDQAKLNNIAAKSDAKVKNTLRLADNTMAAASASLQRYQQSQSNKFVLMSGGNELNAQRTNLLRMADESVRGGLERRIQVAEEAGALAVSAGAAGVGGGSLQMVEAVNRIRFERAEQQAEAYKDQTEEDMLLNIDQTHLAMVMGLSDTQINTSLNFMESTPQLTQRVNWTAAGVKAAATFASTYAQMGGFNAPSSGPTTSLPQQSPAAWAPQQSAAVSTSPFGARPAPTLRFK